MTQRQIKRFKPEIPTFVVLRPEFAKLGKLVDINMDGLCFEYMAQKHPVEDISLLEADIFIGSSGFYLQSIPCYCVYDVIVKDMETLPDGTALRRCKIEFYNLTIEHADGIRMYMKKYTKAIADVGELITYAGKTVFHTTGIH